MLKVVIALRYGLEAKGATKANVESVKKVLLLGSESLFCSIPQVKCTTV